ncbi:calcium-binding protein [Streptomyces wuyuanensis]|uniref:calcium-binding protein n=1 Tax=Streptomyces wuyuanensis TaxID=1196353 RepID=UPI003824314E
MGALSAALAVGVLTAPPVHAVRGDLAITKVVVNGGKPIVLGTGTKTVSFSVTARTDSPIREAFLELWHGTGGDVNASYHRTGTCTAPSAGLTTCSTSFPLDPKSDVISNSLAGGGWQAYAQLEAKDGDYASGDYPAVRVQRAASLTVNAAPEPVAKGKPVTVTGRLLLADWNANKYRGYSGQSVKLQFRKSGSSTYTTLKTLKTNSAGDLRTTVTASADGYWRWTFAGWSTVPAVTTAGDFVDVR